MIASILRKDWRLLWPLAAVGAALQVLTAILLASDGPFHRANLNLYGLSDWISNHLLPSLCLLAVAALTIAAVHQDRWPGTNQDWLIRPISKPRLLLAKILFVAIAGLGPVFLVDVATGLHLGLPIEGILLASVVRTALIFALVVLPALLLASVTRSFAGAIVLLLLVLVVIGVWIIAISRIQADAALMHTGFWWVSVVVLIAANAIGIPALLLLQLHFRAPRRGIWLAGSYLALMPAVIFLPVGPALFVDRLGITETDNAALGAIERDNRHATVSWPPPDTPRSSETKNVAILTVPVRMATGRNQLLMIDRVDARLVGRDGHLLLANDGDSLLRLFQRSDDRSHAIGIVRVSLPADNSHRAFEQGASLELDAWITTIRSTMKVRSNQDAMASPQGEVRCSRIHGPRHDVIQCWSLRPLRSRDLFEESSTPGDLVRISNWMNQGALGDDRGVAWIKRFWRDPFFTIEFDPPPEPGIRVGKTAVEGGDESNAEGPSAVPGLTEVSVDQPAARLVRHLSIPLSEFSARSRESTLHSTDGPAGKASFKELGSLVVDRHGVLYGSDSSDHTIRRIETDGTVTTIAGQPGQCGHKDGRGAEARFCKPNVLAVAPDGALYVIDDYFGLLRRLGPGGEVTTLAQLTVAPKSALDRWVVHHIYEATVGHDGALYAASVMKGGGDIVVRIGSDGRVTPFSGDPNAWRENLREYFDATSE